MQGVKMPKRYRAGVIGRTGKGNYGHGLDRVYLDMENVDIIAVADDDPTGLIEAGHRLGVKKTYGDYREMLQSEWFDIVSIGPRWLDQHTEMVQAVAKAGASIFLEKPIARTLAEADTIIEACEQAGVMLGIAHQGRMHAAAHYAKQLLSEGVLGDILSVQMHGKEDQRGGGEDLMVLGTHLFDMLRFLLGRNPSWVYGSVTTHHGQSITIDQAIEGPEELGLIAGDKIHALFGFGNGLTATFETRRNQPNDPFRYGMWIYGTKGIMTVHDASQQIRIYEAPIWHPDADIPVRDITVEALGLNPEDQSSLNELQMKANVAIVNDVLLAREEGRRPVNSGYDGRWALEMIHGIYASHLYGVRLGLPLDNREHPLKDQGI
jgi:predicted dehydrogenase